MFLISCFIMHLQYLRYINYTLNDTVKTINTQIECYLSTYHVIFPHGYILYLELDLSIHTVGITFVTTTKNTNGKLFREFVMATYFFINIQHTGVRHVKCCVLLTILKRIFSYTQMLLTRIQCQNRMYPNYSLYNNESLKQVIIRVCTGCWACCQVF